MNPIIFSPYYSKIDSNIILPLKPKSSKHRPFLRFTLKILYEFLTSPIHDTCSTHLIILDLYVRTYIHTYTLHTYAGRLESLWTHLITPSRNFVEVW